MAVVAVMMVAIQQAIGALNPRIIVQIAMALFVQMVLRQLHHRLVQLQAQHLAVKAKQLWNVMEL